MILSRIRFREEKIVQYHVGQAFSPIQPRIGSFLYVLPLVIGRCLPSGGGLLEDIEFI